MNKGPWLSAAWWACAVVFAVGLINHFAGLNIDAQYILILVLPILAAIFGDAWVAKEEVKLKVEEIKLARAIKEKS